MRPTRSAPRVLDVCGICLAVLYVVDAIAVASWQGGHAGPAVALVIGSAVAVAAGRVAGSVNRSVVPAIVVASAVAVSLASAAVGRNGPFGYRNAAGAFFVQAVVAALTIAVLARGRSTRFVALALVVVFAIAASKDSTAAAVGLVCVGVCGLALVASIPVRAVVILAALLFVGVLVSIVALGAGYRTGADGPVVDALSERRLELWHGSVQLLADDPMGVGPGRFGEVSPTARRDADARWAHNEFLQQGVELGWVGLVLTVLIFIWGFARLWVDPVPDIATALGAAALAALGIHACVDYIIHFPAVPLAVALIVGNAQAVPLRRFRRDHARHRQESIEDGIDTAGMASAPTAG